MMIFSYLIHISISYSSSFSSSSLLFFIVFIPSLYLFFKFSVHNSSLLSSSLYLYLFRSLAFRCISIYFSLSDALSLFLSLFLSLIYLYLTGKAHTSEKCLLYGTPHAPYPSLLKQGEENVKIFMEYCFIK